MKLKLLVIVLIFVSACTTNTSEIKERNEKQDLQNESLSQQELKKDNIFEDSKIIDTVIIETKTLDEKLLAFSDSILGKPTNIKKQVNEFEIISKNNLISTKVYQKVLLNYEYSSESIAKNVFRGIEKRNYESYWNKTGTMILQKDNLIIFLLKDCQGSLFSSTWNDYEQLFLKFVLEKNEEIEVLNSSCGDMAFHKEIRRRTD